MVEVVIGTRVDGINTRSNLWTHAYNGMKRHGRGLIMRNCSKIECETVAARLACQRLVTVIVSSNSVDHQSRLGSDGDSNFTNRNEVIAKEAKSKSISWYGGKAAISASVEIVKLLQHLLHGSSTEERVGNHRATITWSNATSRALARALGGIDGSNLLSSSTAKAYAAMLVLGGWVSGTLHCGSRVQVVTGPETHAYGTLLRYKAGASTADVVLEGKTEPETIDVVAIRPAENFDVMTEEIFRNPELSEILIPSIKNVIKKLRLPK